MGSGPRSARGFESEQALDAERFLTATSRNSSPWQLRRCCPANAHNIRFGRHYDVHARVTAADHIGGRGAVLPFRRTPTPPRRAARPPPPRGPPPTRGAPPPAGGPPPVPPAPPRPPRPHTPHP